MMKAEIFLHFFNPMPPKAPKDPKIIRWLILGTLAAVTIVVAVYFFASYAFTGTFFPLGASRSFNIDGVPLGVNLEGGGTGQVYYNFSGTYDRNTCTFNTAQLSGLGFDMAAQPGADKGARKNPFFITSVTANGLADMNKFIQGKTSANCVWNNSLAVGNITANLRLDIYNAATNALITKGDICSQQVLWGEWGSKKGGSIAERLKGTFCYEGDEEETDTSSGDSGNSSNSDADEGAEYEYYYDEKTGKWMVRDTTTGETTEMEDVEGYLNDHNNQDNWHRTIDGDWYNSKTGETISTEEYLNMFYGPGTDGATLDPAFDIFYRVLYDTYDWSGGLADEEAANVSFDIEDNYHIDQDTGLYAPGGAGSEANPPLLPNNQNSNTNPQNAGDRQAEFTQRVQNRLQTLARQLLASPPAKTN